METHFVDAYTTYTLKNSALNIRENDVAFIPHEYILKNPNEDIPYQAIKAVYLRKEAGESQHGKYEKGDYIFSYTCTIDFRHRKSIKIKNYIIRNNFSVDKNESYEYFVKEFIEKLKQFPDIKIYAYEGAKVKVINRVDKIFPSLRIGSYVVTGMSLLKVVGKLFLKLTPLLGFDGGDLVMIGIGLTVLIAMQISNFYLKRNAQILNDAPIPPQFFPSSEKNEKFLMN
ncbi:MAG: hypothetical protein EAZ08_11770 [Cytophagales bacterium]|nr:MAG: hypothetical protein EAZ08_11770 [Cytophagales bacterium]